MATVAILCVAALAFAFSLALGDYQLDLGTVFQVLFTGGGSRTERLVVLEWRLPRSLAGVAVGAALGLSGALTQNATRNALASPDILGITSGASAAAVTVLVLGTGGGVAGWLAGAGIPVAAALGGLLTAVAIWALAFRREVDSFRLVLFGVIINALLLAYVNFLLIRAALRDAATAQFWLTGSLGSSVWGRVIPLLVVVACFLPLLAWVSFRLNASSLGTDVEKALGQHPQLTQMSLWLVAVLLASVAVATAGPIGFVAFVAPQLALRLCGLSRPPLIAAALTGAALVVSADLATQHLLPKELPVGLLTSAIGGVFLMYLLVRTNQRTTV